MTVIQCEIKFTSFWFIGTGKESGTYADSLMLKDLNGLPYVPGKTIKVVFREASRIALKNGWFKDVNLPDCWGSVIHFLFGREGSSFQNKNNTVDELTTEGFLNFTSAELPRQEREKIINNDKSQNNRISSLLYRILTNTKVDRKTGTAQKGSLRTIEVAVPVSLKFEISYNEKKLDQVIPEDKLISLLDHMAALIMEIGGKRRRGFGRCIIKVGGNAK